MALEKFLQEKLIQKVNTVLTYKYIKIYVLENVIFWRGNISKGY